jgi:hypothetical protein
MKCAATPQTICMNEWMDVRSSIRAAAIEHPALSFAASAPGDANTAATATRAELPGSQSIYEILAWSTMFATTACFWSITEMVPSSETLPFWSGSLGRVIVVELRAPVVQKARRV